MFVATKMPLLWSFCQQIFIHNQLPLTQGLIQSYHFVEPIIIATNRKFLQFLYSIKFEGAKTRRDDSLVAIK